MIFFLKSKAQISQVFTYLVIILVIGVIVVFGYKGIISILDVDCEKQRLAFENSLLGFIDEYSDKGSVHEESLKAPCDIEEVCFLDSNYCPRSSSEITSLDITDAEVDSVIKSSADDCVANIFLKGEFTEVLKSSDGFLEKIVLKKGDFPFECFKARGGEFKFLFKGFGRKTQIESGWPN